MSSKKATQKDEQDIKEYQAAKDTITFTERPQIPLTASQASAPTTSKINTKALEQALKEEGVSYQQFSGAEETWRKRALKFGTPESKYESMKLKHKWLYDQPIKADV